MTPDRYEAKASGWAYQYVKAELAQDFVRVVAAALRAPVEAHISDLYAIENALDEFEGDPASALRVVGEHVGMSLHNLRAVTP